MLDSDSVFGQLIVHDNLISHGHDTSSLSYILSDAVNV
jgi:hypothetical protein